MFYNSKFTRLADELLGRFDNESQTIYQNLLFYNIFTIGRIIRQLRLTKTLVTYNGLKAHLSSPVYLSQEDMKKQEGTI